MSDVNSAKSYRWDVDNEPHELRLIRVPGTGGEPYLFGRGPTRKAIRLAGFFISSTPVTQALWAHVMGANPAITPRAEMPRGEHYVGRHHPARRVP